MILFSPLYVDQADNLVKKIENVSNEILESYPKIVAIEKNIVDMAQKFVDISKQVQEITHLPKEHHESALRDLENLSKACSVRWMHSLESLDGIQLDDTQTLSKSKRKSVVDCTNSYMDQADELIQQIKTLKVVLRFMHPPPIPTSQKSQTCFPFFPPTVVSNKSTQTVGKCKKTNRIFQIRNPRCHSTFILLIISPRNFLT